ncbi:MAG TPA: sigma 54-interacting transcriptional regulator [Tepidisphaeraceae bacterium]|jgi:DNA-binding NtrC family response regulator
MHPLPVANTMLFESQADLSAAQAISRLLFSNPFLPERIECERAVLGDQFVDVNAAWNLAQDWEGNRPNIGRLLETAERLAARTRDRLAAGERGSEKEIGLYEDVALYLLYYRVHEPLTRYIKGEMAKPPQELSAAYAKFAEDVAHFFEIPGLKLSGELDAPHLFALYFQVRRAFHHTFENIVGSSMPAARLRAAIWQSIFTHNMRRYLRVMYDRMSDLTTLITGPSGTGKELVASAIALSRYIPFDARAKSFADSYEALFHPLNLSAMSPTLIESELFGHRRGAFTGALEDRAGWMEVCQPLGTVFLDEIGELDPAIQVKLLRVLQTRTFQRLGDTKTRHFRGKIIAATNRDLPKEMAAGTFRQDFYYRICSDLIATPSLRDQLAEAPGDLRHMILFITRRIAADEAEPLADEVEAWVRKHLGRDYPWPGNFRELEQCVRNILIRHEYRPPDLGARDAAGKLAEELDRGALTADELLRKYCTLVYSRTRNLEETARRLKLDRRTVKSKVDPELLGASRNGD